MKTAWISGRRPLVAPLECCLDRGMAETDDPDVLRNLATDYANAKRRADLLALEPGLRGDRLYWTSFWGATCAIARWHEGRGDARELLEECIDDGFHDLVSFGTMFDDSFGTAISRCRSQGRLGPTGLPWPLHYVIR